MPRKAQKKTYEKPLSLHPLSFTQALDRLLKAKPVKKAKPKRPKKRS